MARTAVGMLIVLLTALVGSIGAAQESVPAAGAQKPSGHTDQGKGRHGTLTVEVQLVDPAKPNDVQFATNAIVHVEGDEERYETDVKGRAKLLGISTQKVVLQIKVAGVDICRVSNVPITESGQPVIILVEKSQNGKCRLQ